VNGKEIGHNIHGVEPRDRQRPPHFYLDSYTGTDLLCDTVKSRLEHPGNGSFRHLHGLHGPPVP